MLWTYQTHYPYYASGNRKDFHVNNESQDKYLNALSSADNALKEIVAGLEKRDLLKSTLIVIVGDHGEAFGRHGQITHAGGIYEENLHIPLILINPLLFEGNHVPVVGGSVT
jgi:arylsulfatase A-like enzyme